MILAKDLSFFYGKDPIFENAEFFVAKNSKVGLVGQNGSGKSTLFKLITGEEFPDNGRINISGKVMSVPQEVKRDEKMEQAPSVRHYLDPQYQKEDHQLLRILAKLELAHLNLDDHPQNLSGGQKTKLAIARALISEPDILLLDEPTNFLDIAGKAWVMNFLGRYQKTLIIISHDLNLLDKNIDKILEVNPQTKKIEEYFGNYSHYVQLKGEKLEHLSHQIHTQERRLVQMKKGLLKIAGNRSEKGVRMRLNLEKRIRTAQANLPSMPPEAKKIKINLPQPDWLGELPLLALNISKSFGEKQVLSKVDFDIKRGERISLAGPNGVGKSTLIKILLGIVQPDSGEIVKDDRLKIGYYSQEFETFDLNKNLLETVREKCTLTESQIRSLLGRFLFSGDKVFQKVSTLSGGEKTRLSIATILSQTYNLLILDEPTTYLDVLSQRLILESLKLYQGSMIIVSHTPEFISELKPNRQLLLPENKFDFCHKLSR